MLWSEIQVVDITRAAAGMEGPVTEPGCVEVLYCLAGSLSIEISAHVTVRLLRGQLVVIIPADEPAATHAGSRGALILRARLLDAARHFLPSRSPVLVNRPWADRQLALIPEQVNRRRSAGIPTARNVDHVALTVPDLRAAVTFFVEGLGASLLYTEGPIARGSWMTANLNVPANATCEIAMLRFGPSLNLELFEYTGEHRSTRVPRNSDVGGHHLAIFVDDIHAAWAYVRNLPGVTCQGRPKTITEGPLAGDRWLYFTTPWGLQMELISLPEHLPYEQWTTARRYGPSTARWLLGSAGDPEERS
jgi:catechol 2,3-dioxygenase-like lactoylglutathione lyase family enzyme